MERERKQGAGLPVEILTRVFLRVKIQPLALAGVTRNTLLRVQNHCFGLPSRRGSTAVKGACPCPSGEPCGAPLAERSSGSGMFRFDTTLVALCHQLPAGHKLNLYACVQVWLCATFGKSGQNSGER